LSSKRRLPLPETAEVIAATLKRNGIRHVFGLPGGEIAEIMGACRRAGLRGDRPSVIEVPIDPTDYRQMF
jgi:hypothetical protein